MDLTLLQGVAALATALGLGTALPALIKGVISHTTGRAERERSATQHAIAERDGAWQREAAIHRELLDMKSYASRLRRFIYEHCTWDRNKHSVPDWPAEKDE